MSSATFPCAICKKPLTRDVVEGHIAESHSDPVPHKRQHDGEEIEMTDAEFVKANVGRAPGAVTAGLPEATVAPIATAMADLGIKVDDFANVQVTVMAGGVCTITEAKIVFEIVETVVSFRINRASFVANMLYWGFMTSFSEEPDDSGGFTLVCDPTVGMDTKFVTAAYLQKQITEGFKQRNINREFTFRRLGRFLGPSIVDIVERTPRLKSLYILGTPISNRLGIAPTNFLCASSIFEHIKPAASWSKVERDSWSAHNRSVTKVARGSDGAYLPTDLRPAPSRAETLIEDREDDFNRRHRSSDSGVDPRDIYGKGYDMLLGTRKPGDSRGLGA